MGENYLSGRPGIARTSNLTNPVAIGKEQIAIVQTITTNRTRASHSVTWNENMTEAWTLPDGIDPGISLDNSFPYNPPDPVPYNVTSKSNDSPGQTLDGPGGTHFLDTIQRQDDFTLNLMYQPPLGIWSPVISIGAGQGRYRSQVPWQRV